MRTIKPINNHKGQTASLDVTATLLAVTLFTTLLLTLPESNAKDTLTHRTRNEYTHSILLSSMHCKAEGKTVADLLVIHLTNTTQVNKTFIENRVTKILDTYLQKQNKEWLLYINSGEKQVILPAGKEKIGGQEISSANIDLMLLNKEKARIYLWIKWG